jgi:hypothetical protein
MKKLLFLLLAAGLTLGACQPTPTPDPLLPTGEPPMTEPTAILPENTQNPYAPQEGDGLLERADVFLNSVDLLMQESAPPRVAMSISGALPTPCHQLRVKVSPPDAGGRIDVEIYSLYKSGQVCVQVLKDFDVVVELGTYPTGSYQVFVNGDYIGDFSF